MWAEGWPCDRRAGEHRGSVRGLQTHLISNAPLCSLSSSPESAVLRGLSLPPGSHRVGQFAVSVCCFCDKRKFPERKQRWTPRSSERLLRPTRTGTRQHTGSTGSAGGSPAGSCSGSRPRCSGSRAGSGGSLHTRPHLKEGAVAVSHSAIVSEALSEATFLCMLKWEAIRIGNRTPKNNESTVLLSVS